MKPYATGESKKEQVTRMFDAIAPEYDRLDHMLSFNIDRRWRRKVAVMVNKLRPGKVLDVAAGTGDLAIAMARRMPVTSFTAGDLSEGMLGIGMEKAVAKKVDRRIAFIKADAEKLPFTEGEFDAVTAAFGVRNFQDIPAGLGEMYRVLRPGGEVFILEFSMPEGKIFGPLYRFYFKKILPRIGGLVAKDYDAYRYLPGSVEEFPGKERFLELLAGAGFTGCRARPLTRGVAQIYSGMKPLPGDNY